MQSSPTHQQTPSLYISSIHKPKDKVNVQNQRYNRQHQTLYLLKARVSTSALKRFQRPIRKASEKSCCQMKVNSTLDFIGSNIVPCEISRKKVKPLFLNKNSVRQSKFSVDYKQDEKAIERRQRKAKLLTQLVTNYKLNKSTSKGNLKESNFNFPTQPYEFAVNKPSTKLRQFSLQLKEKSNSSNQMQEPRIGFPLDPEIKEIVQHQVSKIWKIQSKNNITVKKFNLLNYYEHSKYQNKIKNVKLILKK